jgi:1,4-dihydroxy-2-naphthoyl-CoA hydrolase
MKNKNKIIEEINTRGSNTMMQALGIKITDLGKNYVHGKMPVDKRTVQPFGVLHGGASVALAETLGSIGGGLQVNQETHGVVGVEINASHLSSISGGWVYGKAEAIRVGRNLQVWEIRITDQNDKIICQSRLTLATIRKKND